MHGHAPLRGAHQRRGDAPAGVVVGEYIGFEIDLFFSCVDGPLQRREVRPAVGQQFELVAAEKFQGHRNSSSTLKAAWSEMRDQGRPW